MTWVSDAEKLRRFVVRARRVEAHSLVQNEDDLSFHASGKFQVQVDMSGRSSVTHRLPADEEVFESLASRLRPLALKSEPIYYVKVFEAIEQALADVKFDQRFLARLRELREAWDATELQGTQTQGYAVQSMRLGGTDATNLVSDTQLAAAWLYADLVHADAKGAKEEALAFPLRERYAAAVHLFSRLAMLTVATLRLIESLRDAGALSIEPSAWEEDVVVETSELVKDARVFYAPVGTGVPDLRDPLTLGSEWTLFTVSELLRQVPANHVRVLLRNEAGETTAAYDAAVSQRVAGETSCTWNVLVAGTMTFKFSFDRQGNRFTGANFRGLETFSSTNELKLASARLRIQLHQAAVAVFEVRDQELVVLRPSTVTDEVYEELEVFEQTVADIVTIEHLTGQTLDPCKGRFNDLGRVRLRCSRLMWEGKIVHAMRQPVTATNAEGRPPQLIAEAAGELDIGGAKVPTPQVLMWHPSMTATETGKDPEAGSGALVYKMEPPCGERFLAWAPELVPVSPHEDLAVTASWDLVGIDETSFKY